MNRKDKEKHYENLLYELEDVKINGRESSYLVDYLYGISDISNEIEEYLRKEENEEWILFYRVLLKKEALKNNLHMISKKENIYFIMENNDDLSKFMNFLNPLKSELEKECISEADVILSKYEDSEIEEKYKLELKPLLIDFLMNKKNKGNSEYAKALSRLGEKIGNLNKKKLTKVKKSDFFYIHFKFTRDEYSQSIKKYKEGLNG